MTKAYSQYSPFQDINDQLRTLFSPICRPTPSPNFLFEMSAHTMDSIFYTDNNPDTIDRDIWYKLYEEMRWSAYDTTVLDRHDSIYLRTLNFQDDTLMVNIMIYDYYKMIDSALENDFYFDWDTVNNTLTEKHPCEIYPFEAQKIFAGSPSEIYLTTNTVTYRVDKDFIFHDSYNDIVANGWTLKIDFDDGTGSHTFNANTVSHYKVTYSTSGKKTLKFEIFNNLGGKIMNGYANLFSPDPTPSYPPDGWIHVTGINAGVYNPCSGAGGPLEKVIIYVEGYDAADFAPKQNTDAAYLYRHRILGNGLAELRNFGYTFVVVDWANSRRDIKDNAASLEELINYLKCQQVVLHNDSATHQQFVIIAESMGGLVARYAMCDMEQNWSTMGGCLPEKMHNTRLLLTFDSPHKGANVPLAYQHTYRNAGFLTLGATGITQAFTGLIHNTLLDSKAAKQMLLYHVDTYNPITHEYSEHSDKTAFDNALSGLGNYPQYTKMFAMSDGSIAGKGQQRYWDGAQRSANDKLIESATESWATILKQDIKLVGQTFRLRTTPNGSGEIGTMSTDLYKPTIKVKVTVTPRWPWPPKVKVFLAISSAYFTTIGFTVNGSNVKPYDVVPGSTYDVNTTQSGKSNQEKFRNAIAVFYGNKTPTYIGSGHFQLSMGSTGRWLGYGASTTIYSDGFNFCFIPTFSSLDYSLPGGNMWHNIETETIANKTSATPFDVIAGITEDYPSTGLDQNIYKYNREHIWVRDDSLGVWDHDTISNTHYRYPACGETGIGHHKIMLNREIGDDSLLVENRTSHWVCQYDAETYIGVNQRSQYYEYSGVTKDAKNIPGVYSKSDNYVIDIPQTYFFARNANVYVTPSTLSTNDYTVDSIHWEKCCTDYFASSGSKFSNGVTHENIKQTGLLQIIPNPVTGDELIAKFVATKDLESRITIYDITGRRILDNYFAVESESSNYSYKLRLTNKESFNQGTYFVLVKNGTRIYRSVIVITQ